ncbi:MAG: tetratricopeptide repeat protein [Dongiaceae bacterium]
MVAERWMASALAAAVMVLTTVPDAAADNIFEDFAKAPTFTPPEGCVARSQAYGVVSRCVREFGPGHVLVVSVDTAIGFGSDAESFVDDEVGEIKSYWQENYRQNDLRFSSRISDIAPPGAPARGASCREYSIALEIDRGAHDDLDRKSVADARRAKAPRAVLRTEGLACAWQVNAAAPSRHDVEAFWLEVAEQYPSAPDRGERDSFDAVVRQVLRSVRLGEAQQAPQGACAGGAAPEVEIAACTRAIESGTLRGEAAAKARYVRGRAYESLRRYDLAIADYTEALRLRPDYVEALNNRGNSYDLAGDHDRAIADYDAALRLAPGSSGTPDLYYNRGVAYDAKGDHDRAIADFDAALRLRPDHLDALNMRGIAHHEKGQLDLAMADYDAVLKLAPASRTAARALKNRALVYDAKGDYVRAIADYDAALRLHPDDPDALDARGIDYGRRGDYDRAIADFDAALRLQPGLASALSNRGHVYALRGDYARALADLDASIRLDPRDERALATRSGVYSETGRPDRALADLDSALRLAPADVELLNDRCWVLVTLGRVQPALADCNKALTLVPGDPSALDSRGFAWLRAGDPRRALADFDAALRRDPRMPTSLFGRSVARRQTGDRAGADRDAAAARALKPDIEAYLRKQGVLP